MQNEAETGSKVFMLFSSLIFEAQIYYSGLLGYLRLPEVFSSDSVTYLGVFSQQIKDFNKCNNNLLRMSECQSGIRLALGFSHL